MREYFRRFLQGRYGPDQFSGFLAWTALFLWLISRMTKYLFLGRACLTIALLLILYVDFRILSKNHGKRYQENERYLILTGKLRRYVQKWQYQWQSKREHRIFTCPSCKQKIRVPRGKGKIAITCPMCRTEFIKRS